MDDDWNAPDPKVWKGAPPRVVDESLRDGLQSPSVRDPPLDRKLAILHTMAAIGVDAVSLGLPAAGPRAVFDTTELAKEVVRSRIPIAATAAARTVDADVRAIIDVSQRAGLSIEVYAFVGCSPIRRFVEGWTVPWLIERIESSCKVALEA